MFDLEQILATLEKHRQRATYNAAAMVAGGVARGIMRGRPKNPRNCWIVSSRTGLPTGYAPEEMHPQLQSRATVISSGPILCKWICDRAEEEN